MNFRERILNFFRGLVRKEDVDEIERIADQSADLMFGAFVKRFQARGEEIMFSSHTEMLGYEPDIEDAEFEILGNTDKQEWTPSVDDYENCSRPNLMKKCRESEPPISYTTSSKSKELIAKLVRRDKKLIKQS